MIIAKQNSSIKTNFNLRKSIKEIRKEAKYQNNNNPFLKMEQPGISLYNNINLRYKDFNKLDMQKTINNNLFIYKKNFFLNYKQIKKKIIIKNDRKINYKINR